MNSINYYDFFFLSPEIIFVLAGLVLLFLRRQKYLCFLLIIGGTGLSMVLNILMFNVNKDIIYNTMEVSDLSVLLRVIILAGTLIFIISTKEFAFNLEYTNMYYAFLSFASLGMIILPSAKDLLTIFIAFELTSISTYALPFIDQKSENRFEAGIKYFLTGAFSSGLILFGMSYVFGMTGTLNLSEIAVNIAPYQGSPILYLAFMLMLSGFSYKMALAPFHLWAPDTYSGSPSPVSGYLAGITKKGPFVAAFKIFLVGFAVIKLEQSFALGFLAILTMTTGNLAALVQKNVKRMIAFSSVANAGTILVGFSVGNLYGLSGAIIHIAGHLVMTVGAFMVIWYIEETRDNSEIDSFAGLNKSNPLLAISMVVFMMSLGGIPPLLGFWSKIVIILGAVDAGGLYFFLAVALILNSALSLVYYFRVIKYMYMKEPLVPENIKDVPFAFGKVGIGLSAALIIVSGLVPGKFVQIVINAVEIFIG